MSTAVVAQKIQRAEQMLNEWLVDNTEDVFEEEPEIDEARGLLNKAIELLHQMSKGHSQ